MEDPDKNKKTEEELLKDLSPEVKAYLESMKQSVGLLAKKVGDSVLTRQMKPKRNSSEAVERCRSSGQLAGTCGFGF